MTSAHGYHVASMTIDRALSRDEQLALADLLSAKAAEIVKGEPLPARIEFFLPVRPPGYEREGAYR